MVGRPKAVTSVTVAYKGTVTSRAELKNMWSFKAETEVDSVGHRGVRVEKTDKRKSDNQLVQS